MTLRILSGLLALAVSLTTLLFWPWAFSGKAYRPVGESEVYSLVFKNEDVESCYTDSFRDLDSKLIVNHDYSQMASNFDRAISLKFPEYVSGNQKSKEQVYRNLKPQSKKELVTALVGIICNHVIQNQNDEALDILLPIAAPLLSEKNSINLQEAVIALGFIEGKRGKYKKAIEIFEKSIEQTRHGKDRHYISEALYGRALAQFMMAKANYKDRKRLLAKIREDLLYITKGQEFEQFPFRLETYWLLGEVGLLEAPDSADSSLYIQSAIDAFSKAVESDSSSYHIVNAYDGLGLAYMAIGNYESAIESIRKALARIGFRCESPYLYLHLGEALVLKEEYLEGAKQCLLAKRLKSLDIDVLEADNCVSEYYIHLGNQKEEDINGEVENLLDMECGTSSRQKVSMVHPKNML